MSNNKVEARRRTAYRRLFIVLCTIQAAHASFWLAPLQPSSRRSVVGRTTPTTLLLARSKKSKSPVQKSKAKTTAPSNPSASLRKKKSASKPPWQVLTGKAAKKNAEREKLRRQQVQQGGLSNAVEKDTTQVGALSTAFLSDEEQRLLKWARFNPERQLAGVRFVGAYLDDQTLPPRLGVPEVAFLGRSNVGKSLLLNTLSKKSGSSSSDQARVGKTPGATASVNLFVLQGDKGQDLLGFVDLPGFGYAKLSKETQDAVQAAAENYLSRRKNLALGILLVDVRRTPSDDDRAVLAALYDLGVPLVVVATKMDKVPAKDQSARLDEIRDNLGLPEGQPLAISSVTGEGIKSLWRIILEQCEDFVFDLKRKYDENALSEADQATESSSSINEEAFRDGDDVSYSQGFDWIHDSAIRDEGDGELDGVDGDDEIHHHNDESSITSLDSKELKKRARRMERQGEV